MPTCRICLHVFTSLKFQTEHVDICTRCVNTLNASPEPAKNAEARFAEKLARGIRRGAERDLQSSEEWRCRKAIRTLNSLDAMVAEKLHDWITKLLADPGNSTRDFKIMRAYRRGLLRMDGFSDHGDQSCGDRNWKEIARRIRRRDGFKCMACGATNTTLDVHHILYLSHHGTNRRSNLITLCRACHEAEHDQNFDWAESQDSAPESSIQYPSSAYKLQPEQRQAVLRVDRSSAIHGNHGGCDDDDDGSRLSIHRAQIEAFDLDGSLAFLRALVPIRDPQYVRSWQGTLSISIIGYDNSREFFDIPEVCRYFRGLDQEWPFWFFFLDPPSIKLVGMCLVPAMTVSSGKVLLPPENFYRFMERGFGAVNHLFEHYGFPGSESEALSDVVSRMFSI